MLPLFQQSTRMILDNAGAMIQALQMAQIQSMLGGQPQLGPAGAPGGVQFGGAKPEGNPHGANPHNSLASVAGEAGRTT
jgi:hypothetical protein